jgi:transposase, IS6 family
VLLAILRQLSAFSQERSVPPHVITVDKKAAYPQAFNELKAAGTLASPCELRQSKYLNNLVEQDHRFIKRLVKPGMGFFSFETAWRNQEWASFRSRRLANIARI